VFTTEYTFTNCTLGASSWSQKLIYIMMHGQRNIITVVTAVLICTSLQHLYVIVVIVCPNLMFSFFINFGVG
jgi:hypothetical protein